MPRSRSSTLPTSLAPIPSTFTDGLPLPTVLVFDLDYTLWPFWVDTHCTGPLKPASPSITKQSRNNDAEQTFNKSMIDRYGEHFAFYTEVPTVLAAARARGITMSVASRTHAPDMAQTMLRGLYVPPLSQQDYTPTTATTDGSAPVRNGQHDSTPSAPPNPLPLPNPNHTNPLRGLDFFVHPQMYPGSKTTHFQRIQSSLRKHQHRDIPYDDMIFFDDEARNRNVERELGAVFVLVPDGVTSAEVDRGVREWRRRKGIQGGVADARNGGDQAEAEL